MSSSIVLSGPIFAFSVSISFFMSDLSSFSMTVVSASMGACRAITGGPEGRSCVHFALYPVQ